MLGQTLLERGQGGVGGDLDVEQLTALGQQVVFLVVYLRVDPVPPAGIGSVLRLHSSEVDLM